MAHKKGASSSSNGRDSNAKRLGVKRYGGPRPAKSSSGSAAPSSTPVRTLVAAATTPCSHSRQGP